jgi:hypothetical protein
VDEEFTVHNCNSSLQCALLLGICQTSQAGKPIYGIFNIAADRQLANYSESSLRRVIRIDVSRER